MKVGILGAGISGLSVGKLLNSHLDVEVLEALPGIGGIAQTRSCEGSSYHPIGGHCFNSKHQDVLDFVFKHVLEKKQWNTIERKAVIKLKDKLLTYPIEFAVKQIAEFDPDLAIDITADFLNTYQRDDCDDLETWFRTNFGNTLAEIYFLPYNQKIWNMAPRKMQTDWVRGKLPIPDKHTFFRGLLGNEKDKMPHSSFFYPKTNDQKTFIDSLAQGIRVILNYRVNEIEFDKSAGEWIINNDKRYGILISTLPLNNLPSLIKNTPQSIIDESKKLKYNKISTMLWKTKETKQTWTYIPDSDTIFHRYIHIGNFFTPSKNLSITEAVGERSYEEMALEGKKDSFLIEPLDYNVSDHAYVVFDDNYSNTKSIIKNYMDTIEINLLGRFGEWEYYNMDECIKRSIILSENIINKYIFKKA